MRGDKAMRIKIRSIIQMLSAYKTRNVTNTPIYAEFGDPIERATMPKMRRLKLQNLPFFYIQESQSESIST